MSRQLLIFRQGGFSALDAAYWSVVASLVGARYIDVAHFHGLTADAEPASMQHFRRYALALSAVAAGLWGCVHLLGLLR